MLIRVAVVRQLVCIMFYALCSAATLSTWSDNSKLKHNNTYKFNIGNQHTHLKYVWLPI